MKKYYRIKTTLYVNYINQRGKKEIKQGKLDYTIPVEADSLEDAKRIVSENLSGWAVKLDESF